MKPLEFQAFQYARLEKRVYEEADEEASDDHEFKNMVYAFIRKATVSFNQDALLDGGCYVEGIGRIHFRLTKLVEYFKSQKDNTSQRQICFNLRNIMKAKNLRGKVYNKVLKKDISCPTWHFESDTEQYTVLGDAAKKVTHEKD